MRERPLREKKPRKVIEEDATVRSSVSDSFPIPAGEPAFRDGYREAISMFALHSPNKRGVARILDEHCITLENACMRDPSRENYAAYEGYRQAVKDLRAARKMK
jgi:hypothetical protein